MKERRNRIVDFINREGSVTFAQLTGEFSNVSEMTLRNDLKFLDQELRIVRIHGGARSNETVVGSNTPLNLRNLRNVEKKRQIAQKALRFLRPDSAIFLDSGSTTTELAKIMPNEPFHIFCGGVSCINEMAQLTVPSLYVLGGRFSNQSLSTYGMQNYQEIARLNFNTAFLSVTGYHSGRGFSGPLEERCEQKRLVIERSEQVIVLMDSQKVGLLQTFHICKPEEIDILISDDELDSRVRAEFEASGVDVY